MHNRQLNYRPYIYTFIEVEKEIEERVREKSLKLISETHNYPKYIKCDAWSNKNLNLLSRYGRRRDLCSGTYSFKSAINDDWSHQQNVLAHWQQKCMIIMWSSSFRLMLNVPTLMQSVRLCERDVENGMNSVQNIFCYN